jgi:ArsR family transcriptional regulator
MIKQKLTCDCDTIHKEVVEKVKYKMLPQKDFSLATDFLSVVGNDTRFKILWALKENEMCVCDIAVLLNMTKSALSHQLKVLKNANLVKSREYGKIRYYSLADNHATKMLEQISEHLTENER